MNKKQQKYLEKGYGTFPYFIVRIRSGLYKQIPIHFKEKDLDSKEGVYVELKPESTIDEIQERCLMTLIKVLEGSPDIRTSGDLYLRAPGDSRRLNGCLVLEPDTALYINEYGEVTESSIPWGGTLVSIGNHWLEFTDGNHYLLV